MRQINTRVFVELTYRAVAEYTRQTTEEELYGCMHVTHTGVLVKEIIIDNVRGIRTEKSGCLL